MEEFMGMVIDLLWICGIVCGMIVAGCYFGDKLDKWG